MVVCLSVAFLCFESSLGSLHAEAEEAETAAARARQSAGTRVRFCRGWCGSATAWALAGLLHAW